MRSIVFIPIVALCALFTLFSCGSRKEVVSPVRREAPETRPAPKPVIETPKPAPAPEIEPEKPQHQFREVNFDFDRYDLRQDAKEILAGHAQALKENPSLRLRIEGHCDERGTTEYNLALGERRAFAVKNYFIVYGIDAARLSTISYGEEKPLDPRHDEEAWAKNRRAAFVVLGRER